MSYEITEDADVVASTLSLDVALSALDEFYASLEDAKTQIGAAITVAIASGIQEGLGGYNLTTFHWEIRRNRWDIEGLERQVRSIEGVQSYLTRAQDRAPRPEFLED